MKPNLNESTASTIRVKSKPIKISKRSNVSYEAKVAIKKGQIFLKPIKKISVAEEKMALLPFNQGSQLFATVIGTLKKKFSYINPDSPDTYPTLPDPFGILLGNQPVPLALLNPAVDEPGTPDPPQSDSHVKCYTVHVPAESGGVNSYVVCTCE